MNKNINLKADDFTSITYVDSGDIADLFTCEMQGRSDKLVMRHKDWRGTLYIVSEAMGVLSDCMEENQIFQLSRVLEGVKAFTIFKERISRAESIIEFEEIHYDLGFGSDFYGEQQKILFRMLEEREKEVFPERGTLKAEDFKKIKYVGTSDNWWESIYTCEIQGKSGAITVWKNFSKTCPAEKLSPNIICDGKNLVERMLDDDVAILTDRLKEARLYSSYKEKIAKATSLSDFDEIYERISKDYRKENLTKWQKKALKALLKKTKRTRKNEEAEKDEKDM